MFLSAGNWPLLAKSAACAFKKISGGCGRSIILARKTRNEKKKKKRTSGNSELPSKRVSEPSNHRASELRA